MELREKKSENVRTIGRGFGELKQLDGVGPEHTYTLGESTLVDSCFTDGMEIPTEWGKLSQRYSDRQGKGSVVLFVNQLSKYGKLNGQLTSAIEHLSLRQTSGNSTVPRVKQKYHLRVGYVSG